MIHNRIGNLIRPSQVVIIVKDSDLLQDRFPRFQAFVRKAFACNYLSLREGPISDNMIKIGMREQQ
ncbi:hypothetical protein D3C75_1066380 [compost metagenome]